MARYRVGWLPYGSDDEDVVIRHPLTSAPAAADLGYTTRTIVGAAGGPVHDPVLGMKGADAAGAASLYRFDTANAAVLSLEQEGQLSLEVQREWIASNSATLAESSGKVIAAAGEGPFRFQNTTGTQNSLTFYKQANGSVVLQCGGGSNQANTPTIGGERLTSANGLPLIHSAGKGEWVTINCAWWGGVTGGEYILAIDGLILVRSARVHTGATDNLFIRCFLGGRNDATNTMATNWMRRLQVAKRAPIFPINRKIGRVGVLSDSILDFSNTFSSSFYGDAMGNHGVLRVLQKSGIRVDGWTESETGGATIISAGGNQLASQRAAILAARPATVIICGGTNDIGGSAATFTTDYRDHIEFFMGVGAHAANTVRARRVFACTLPNGTTQLANPTSFLALQAVIRGLPAWWDATYPAQAGAVGLIDLWGMLGGQAVTSPAYFVDGAHYNAQGIALASETIARALLQVS